MRPLFGVRRRIGIRVTCDGEFGEAHDGVDFLPECRILLNADRAAIKLVNTEEHRFDAFLGRRLEGFPEDDIPESLEGMEARNTTIDLGVSYRYSQTWGTLRASAMHDVGGVNHGSELRCGYSYDWRGDRWTLRPDISVAWRDSKLNNYYYGVREDEATEERAAYAPGSGVNVSLGLYGSYSILENWRLLGGISVTSLDSSVRDSPIINDDLQPALFLGAVYDFGTPLTNWDDDGSPLLVKVNGRAGASVKPSPGAGWPLTCTDMPSTVSAAPAV